MALARSAAGSTRAVYRPAARALFVAMFGVLCFFTGTCFNFTAIQQQGKQAAPTVTQCQALLRREQLAQAAPLQPCEPAEPGVATSSAADATSSRAVVTSSGAASGAASTPTCNSPYLVPINITQILGGTGSAAGILYSPRNCMAPWKLTFKNDEALISALQAKLTSALVQWARPLAAPETTEDQLQTIPLLHVVGASSIEDPLVGKLHPSLADLLSRFVLTEQGTRLCVCGQLGDTLRVTSADEVGPTGCKDGQSEPEQPGFSCMGSVLGPLAQHRSIADWVEDLTIYGMCSFQVTEPTFGEWWIKERLNNPAYRAFNTDTEAKDTLLELFDMLYETEHVFLRQKWLGFATMQNGFDLLSVSNLIHELRPSIIVETGTAAGGSAVLWASVLELLELHDSRIHTIDTNPPSTGFGANGKDDPTNHKLWSKYIRFHQGVSSDAAVLAAIKEATQNASTVLVLLDSDHSEANVAQELDNYCNVFVTVGSYCVVEDTKMTRMGPSTGPLDALKKWMAAQGSSAGPKWEADRSRELLYTQYPMGYLKRTA